MTKKTSVAGAETLFGAAFTYALTGILVREVAPMWGNNAQAAVRFGLVLIFLTAYGAIKKDKTSVPLAKLPMTVGFGFLFALVVLFFNAAIEATTVANTLFTYYATNMVISFLLGTFLLDEKITFSKIAGIIMALAGLSVYAHALFAGNIGLFYGIAAGVCDGLSNVFRKKLTGVDRNATIRIQYLVGTIVTWGVTLFSGQAILKHASIHVGLLTLLFALVLIAGSNLMLYGFQNFDVNIGTVIMSTELVFATIMAYFLFHEIPKPHELVGGVLIFGASIIGSGVLDKIKQHGPGEGDRAV